MSTELLLLIEASVIFAMLLVCSKVFGKDGLTVWVALATILANIFTTKSAIVFGSWGYAEGTVLFASIFLATDLLTELYGKRAANNAVNIGLVSNVLLIVTSQIALLYAPADWSIGVHESLETIFALSLRVTISSMIMYFIANKADIYLFDLIKQKTEGKHLWLRNNVATILCNCLENFLFMFGAFLGLEGYTVGIILEMAITTSVIEALVGLFDTPFLYLGVKFRHKEKSEEVTE